MSNKHDRSIDLWFGVIYSTHLNSRKIDVLFYSESITNQICPVTSRQKTFTSQLLIKGKHDFELIEHSADETNGESSKERRKYYLSISSVGEIKLATLTNNRSEFIRDR